MVQYQTGSTPHHITSCGNIISLGKPKYNRDRLTVIIGQAVPCPLSPEDCQWPTDFTELLDMRFVSLTLLIIDDGGGGGGD